MTRHFRKEAAPLRRICDSDPGAYSATGFVNVGDGLFMSPFIDACQATVSGGEGKEPEHRRADVNRDRGAASKGREGGGMNIPVLPSSLETAARSFGGRRRSCLFPAGLFA